MGKLKNKKSTTSIRHIVPEGFWSQVFSVAILIVALIILIGLLGIKGWLTSNVIEIIQYFIGISIYIFPIVLIGLSLKRLFSKEGKLPISVIVNSLIFTAMLSAIVSILSYGRGGVVGDFISGYMVSMLGSVGSTMIFTLTGAINLMFIFSKTPRDVYGYFKSNITIPPADEEQSKTIKFSESGDERINTMGRPRLKLKSILAGKNNSGHFDGIQKPKTELKVQGNEDQPIMSPVSGGAKKALTINGQANWLLPESELLESKTFKPDAGDIKKNAQIIKDTLADFKVDVEMEEANIGPRVTQFTLKPPSGVRLQKITALDTNIALNLAAESIRIEAPIPGKKAVGIEVPNRKSAIVTLRSVIESKIWLESDSALSFAIGKDISGIPMVGELDVMPHLLIAGQTGSGKSIMINTFLISLLYRNPPSDLKLILVDPKRVELSPYNHIPHLLTQVITNPEKCLSALKWAVDEMERRYELLAENGKREIKSYNISNIQDKLPYIVIVIDELADLMMVAAKEVESLIVRIAQKARAVGIHLVLATQRPSVDVITGLIKANIPARIAFTVASQIDSRTIIDQTGAEKLLGRGDLLYTTPQVPKPKRIQGAFVSEYEINNVVNFIKSQAEPNYDDNVIKQHVNIGSSGGIVMDIDGSSGDEEILKDAIRVVVESGKASASLLQRRLRIGYSRASRLIDIMEERGIIGPADGARPREVLINSIDSESGSEYQL